MHDEWSGLASLLAELIEKHASELNLDNLPLPRKEPDEKYIQIIMKKSHSD